MFTNLIKHGLYMVDTYVVSFIGKTVKCVGSTCPIEVRANVC